MNPYLQRCDGNRKEALDLYRWHGELAAAVQIVLGNTEVILRNAVDRQLQIWNQKQIPNANSWLLEDPASPLRSLTARKRKDALRRARTRAEQREESHPRRAVAPTHDDVLAHVMFGMWKDLLPNHMPEANPSSPQNQNRIRLWNEALHLAFPHAEDLNGAITFWRVAHLHRLRNRISHVEPLFGLDVAQHIQDAFSLVATIDKDTAQWLSGISRVSSILNQRPEIAKNMKKA